MKKLTMKSSRILNSFIFAAVVLMPTYALSSDREVTQQGLDAEISDLKVNLTGATSERKEALADFSEATGKLDRAAAQLKGDVATQERAERAYNQFKNHSTDAQATVDALAALEAAKRDVADDRASVAALEVEVKTKRAIVKMKQNYESEIADRLSKTEAADQAIKRSGDAHAQFAAIKPVFEAARDKTREANRVADSKRKELKVARDVLRNTQATANRAQRSYEQFKAHSSDDQAQRSAHDAVDAANTDLRAAAATVRQLEDELNGLVAIAQADLRVERNLGAKYYRALRADGGAKIRERRAERALPQGEVVPSPAASPAPALATSASS